MASPYSDLLQSYATLASSMVDRWSALASRAASKIDSGAYDPASAAQDAAAGAALAAESGWLWADWMFNAVAKFAGIEGGPNIVRAEFESPVEGAKLELAGPLVKGAGPETLPAEVVSIQPAQLEPKQTKFTLCADASAYHGATYVGTVNAITDAGTTPVLVWIVVP